LSPPQLVLTVRENQRDNHTDRYELYRSIQANRRGGRTKSPGSKPIDQNGPPVCVLPNKPLPRINRTYGQTRTEPHTRIFMPREAPVSAAPVLLTEKDQSRCAYC